MFLFLPHFQQLFLNFQCCSFPLAVLFVLPAGTNLSDDYFFFPYPNLSFFLCCARARIRKELTASPTSSSLGPAHVAKPALPSSEGSSHRASASTASHGTWGPPQQPCCALLPHTRLVCVVSLVHKSLPLDFSPCPLCSSSRAVGCVAEAASLWLINNQF